MRITALVLVVFVLGWFGYSFLADKSEAKAGEEGEATSIVVDAAGAPSEAKAPKYERKEKGAGTPFAPIEEEIKKGNSKEAEILVKKGASKGVSDPRFRQLALKACRLAMDKGELERSARIIGVLLDEWSKKGIDWEKDAKEWDVAKGLLQRVMNKLLFNPGGAWRSRTYEVKPGDSLERIRKMFLRKERLRVTSGFLAAVNRIHPKQLRPGQKLRIPLGRMRIVVEKKSYVLKLFLDDILIRIYRVGLGKNDSTPEARFTVELKQKHPVWWNPEKGPIPYGHPDNPLGDYFIKLKSDRYTGFGIHSVKESERHTIGKNYSMGCIRMYPEETEELFNFVPKGTEVVVR